MMDATNTIACKVELITPERFLFNAGKTNKNLNEKMLKSPHFKALSYAKDSMRIFPFQDPENEAYNFKIWAETMGEFIHKVQLLAFNYKEEDRAFSDKLDVLCDGLTIY